MKISALTTDYTIETATRDELRDALCAFVNHTRSEINKLNKAERVALAIAARDDLKRQAAQRAEQLQIEHAAKVNEQAINPVHQATIEAALDTIREIRDQCLAKLVEIHDAMVDTDPLSMGWKLEHGAVNQIYYQTKLHGHLTMVVNYLADQAANRTHTVSEIREKLHQNRDRLVNECLNGEGYAHNSTDEIDSIKGREEHSATQTAARVMNQLCNGWDKDIIKVSEHEVENVTHIMTSRWM